MEADHLVLAVDVIEAVRGGAGLIVSNSSLDSADQLLADVCMDPMRGRAAILWNGILQVLLDEERFDADLLRGIPGAGEFLASRDFPLATVADLTGVDAERIRKAAGLIRDARRPVFFHSPDRPQDQAPGDMEVLAAFVVLLRTSGLRADLLLPRVNANSAAMDLMGADPAFLPGRKAAGGLPGAGNREELRGLLAEGRIRAALIVGEDPLRNDRTASYFQNVDFLAAVDWTETETTQFADAILPAATFFESEGTRCNFEGRVTHFRRAVQPPSGYPGWKVLAALGEALGLKNGASRVEDLGGEIDRVVREALGDRAPYYWNTGEERLGGIDGRLCSAEVRARAGSIQPPLTHSERYKREIREVGTERFRVR